MRYFNTFKILIVAGFENIVRLYKMNAEYLECTRLGELKGHLALINTV
jgi:hypothetical protein